MGRYGVKGVRRCRDLLQDDVLLDLLPQESDIVSQAADFGGDFIDHRQAHNRPAIVAGRPVEADAGVSQDLSIHAAFEIVGEAPLRQFLQKAGRRPRAEE